MEIKENIDYALKPFTEESIQIEIEFLPLPILQNFIVPDFDETLNKDSTRASFNHTAALVWYDFI